MSLTVLPIKPPAGMADRDGDAQESDAQSDGPAVHRTLASEHQGVEGLSA
jgi:hypothetical protein